MRRIVPGSLVVISFVALACAKDQPAPPLPPAAEPAAAAPPVVEISASEYAFQAPDTVPGGLVTIRLHERGKELHHVMLWRLGEGKTLADAAKLSDKDLPVSWITAVGGPNSPLPGETMEATLDLAPGNYVLICVIPSPDGTPHAVKGMLKAITVVPGSNAVAVVPAPDVTLTLSNYDFQFSKELTPGKHVIRVESVGTQWHEVEIVRLNPGTTVDAVPAWLIKQVGPPPARPLGGTTAIAPGGWNQITVDLPPGEYGLMCFLPDEKDHAPHFMHKMIKQFTIKA